MRKNKPKSGPTKAQQKLVAQYLLDDALDALGAAPGARRSSTYSIRWGAACIEVAAVLGVRPGSPKMRKAREFLKKEREEARNG